MHDYRMQRLAFRVDFYVFLALNVNATNGLSPK